MADTDTNADSVPQSEPSPESPRVWGGHDLTEAQIDELYGPESAMAQAERPDGSKLYPPESVAAIRDAFLARRQQAVAEGPKEAGHTQALRKAGAFILGSGPVSTEPCDDCGQTDTAKAQAKTTEVAAPGPQFISVPTIVSPTGAVLPAPEAPAAPAPPALAPAVPATPVTQTEAS